MDLPKKPFDNGSKRLVAISAQDLLDWLAPGSRFTGQFSEQFQSAELEADAMLETYLNGEREFAHFEFQSGRDPDMAQRMLEYAVLAHGRYKCAVRSYVLYLRPCGPPPITPLIRTYADGEQFLWFYYRVIEIWKQSHREVLDHGAPGLLPFVPLMQGGAQRKVIEEVIERLPPAHGKMERELISLVGQFTNLAFADTPADLAWARRRFQMLKDIFKDTDMTQWMKEWLRDEVKEEVRAEVKGKLKEEARAELEEARAKVMEAHLQSQRALLLTIVRARFPMLADLTKILADQIKDVDVLEGLVGRMGSARTRKQAQQVLLTWQQIERSS